jgi:predicted GIY-YIG superfamily endonuclease
MTRRKQKPRLYYKYQFKLGNKIVHEGITKDLERREQEHRQRRGWGKGHINQVGRRTTEQAAREWEEERGAS